ncbi:hypothetical protein ACIA5C_05630 [Actinoplanes sp. NPDC051343]|uniref:hypothetical protein n=1 Tax=Actinoplanes sp. NPDC051343 TaxID=3363906 RepID=UPI0037AD04AF
MMTSLISEDEVPRALIVVDVLVVRVTASAESLALARPARPVMPMVAAAAPPMAARDKILVRTLRSARGRQVRP